MKKVSMLIIGILIAFETPASAQTTVEERSGGGVSILLGGSFCVENDSSECNYLDGGFGFSISPMYRLFDYFAASMDIFYGMYSTNSDDLSASSFGILIGPRAYLPIGPIDLFAGFGVGYATFSADSNGGKLSGGGLNAGLNAGMEYRVIKNLGVGISGRINFNFADDVCQKLDGQNEECSDGDLSHNVIVGGQATWYF